MDNFSKWFDDLAERNFVLAFLFIVTSLFSSAFIIVTGIVLSKGWFIPFGLLAAVAFYVYDYRKFTGRN